MLLILEIRNPLALHCIIPESTSWRCANLSAGLFCPEK